jgi:hypothetical protein
MKIDKKNLQVLEFFFWGIVLGASFSNIDFSTMSQLEKITIISSVGLLIILFLILKKNAVSRD